MSGPTGRRAPVIALALLLVSGGFLLALFAAHVDPPHPAAVHISRVVVPQTISRTNTEAPPSVQATTSKATGRARHEVGALVLTMYLLLILAAVATVAVFLARMLLTRRGAHERERTLDEDGGSDHGRDLVAARLAEAAVAGLDELAAERPATDVIIACWQRLRAVADQAGLAPVASDTPDEAIGRLLRAGAVSAPARRPLGTLAELYREARFSDHAMTRGDVWVAREALRTIIAELRPDDPAGLARPTLPHGSDDAR